ncbi:unnamed protein product [Rotaria magnacalcarata]|uniref:Uncharacterized protein n=2 Tax=Rotaria magnacalcarata TaxID=392030 RepID=A0A820NI79_9BILA|nr:unnamed protein product [Rotaria magnacalcarata]
MSGRKSTAAMPLRRRMTQNYLVIWVDGNIDESNDDCQNTLAQLRAVDIILEIDGDDKKSMNTLKVYCRDQNIPEAEINDFKRKYRQKSPVWWYTKEIFLYGMLNRALRSLDMEAMIKLGFFIRHLHIQLEELHQEQSANFQKAFIVYRGQGLSQQDFQNLSDSKGGLLSFNNFLSTS